MILVGPVLVFLAFGLIASAQSHWLIQRLLEIEPLGYLMVVATAVMPLILLSGAFTFLYKFIPHTHVQLSSALIGGVSAAILWQLAGKAFTAFVVNSTRYTAIYSSLAILIFFLLWLYVAWMIVLIGGQIAYFHQNPSAYLNRQFWRRNSISAREFLALTVLVRITRRYLSGQPPSNPTELALYLNVPLAVVEDIIDRFIQFGIVFRTSEPEGIALGHPPENIPVVQVLDILRDRDIGTTRSYGEESDRVAKILQQRDQAIRQSLSEVTLRSLAEETTEQTELMKV